MSVREQLSVCEQLSANAPSHGSITTPSLPLTTGDAGTKTTKPLLLKNSLMTTTFWLTEHN